MSPLAPRGEASSGLSFKWKMKNDCDLEILNSGAYQNSGCSSVQILLYQYFNNFRTPAKYP